MIIHSDLFAMEFLVDKSNNKINSKARKVNRSRKGNDTVR